MLGVGSVPAEKMSASGTRALAATEISLSTVSLPKGIQFSQMRDARVLVASPIDTCAYAPSIIPQTCSCSCFGQQGGSKNQADQVTVHEECGPCLDVIVEGGQLKSEAAAVVPFASAAGRPRGQLHAVRLRGTPAYMKQSNHTTPIAVLYVYKMP